MDELFLYLPDYLLNSGELSGFSSPVGSIPAWQHQLGSLGWVPSPLHMFLTLFTNRWCLDTTATNIKLLSPSSQSFVSLGQLTPASPSVPATTSALRLSQAPHRTITTASQATWRRLTALLIPTPQPAEGGLPSTASAPRAAPTKEAVTVRSSSGRTSSRFLRVSQRIQQSSECEWTAGWHKASSYVTIRHQGEHRKDTYANDMWGFYWNIVFNSNIFVSVVCTVQ